MMITSNKDTCWRMCSSIRCQRDGSTEWQARALIAIERGYTARRASSTHRTAEQEDLFRPSPRIELNLAEKLKLTLLSNPVGKLATSEPASLPSFNSAAKSTPVQVPAMTAWFFFPPLAPFLLLDTIAEEVLLAASVRLS